MIRSALIVGLGSIGRRHLTNLRKLAADVRITVWRHQVPMGNRENPEDADRVVYTLADALSGRPDMAIVAGPSAFHVETALALAGNGIPVFVEKPLSNSCKGVAELLNLCKIRSIPLMVGYNLRFYRPLQILRQAIVDGRVGRVMSIRAEVGQYLPDWRVDCDYRRGVSANRDLGGGVVLELSHELDYLRWIGGEVKLVTAQTARLSDLEIDVEDTAEIILGFSSGVMGSVHLDMTQRAPTRSCRVAGTEGTLAWDGITHSVRLYDAESRAWTDLHPVSAVDRNEMFLAELRHFLDCAEHNGVPSVSGEDGWRALSIALAVKESSAKCQPVAPDFSPEPAILGTTTKL